MGLLIWIDKKIDVFTKGSMWIAKWCLFLMVLLINTEVILRYFFNFSTLIADEYGAYLFVACSFLGFAYCFRRGDFLRVNALIELFPPNAIKYFHFGTALLGFLFSVIITWEVAKLPYVNFIYGSSSIQPSATPLFIPQLLLPLGMASMSIVFFNEAVQALIRKAGTTEVTSGKEMG